MSDEVLEGRRLVPDDEVFYVLREPPSKRAAQRDVAPATVGSQGAEFKGVFGRTTGPLNDAVQPPGCISSA